MRYLLDTTLFIDVAVGLPAAGEIVRQLFETPNDLYTCDAIVAEALSGGSDGQRRAIEAMLAPLEYVSTDPTAAHWAAESRRSRGAGSPRTLGDALIAAVARSLDATVVTRNPDDFARQGVRVLGYQEGQ